MPNHIILTYKCNLSCPYCYAKNLKFPDMKIEDFEKILDWFSKQNIKNISLTGGEPTIYPYFDKAIDLMKEKGFKASLLTNALFSEKISDLITKDVIAHALVSHHGPDSYTKTQKLLFEKNLQILSNKNINLTISHNIEDEKTLYKHIINTCLKYDIKRVRFSVTTPSIAGGNIFTSLDTLKISAPSIIKFVEDCVKNNFKLILSRPLPFCIFSKEEQQFLRKHKALVGGCNPARGVFAINPDLSVYPCTTLQLKGPSILSFKDKKEINKYYSEKINKLKWKTYLFDECKNCRYNLRRQCCGACLAYKIS